MKDFFSIYRGKDGLALKLRYYLCSEAKGGDNLFKWAGTDLVLIPIWIWKEVEDDAAPVSYFDSNFLPKIPIDSRLVFFEMKFIIYNFFRNRENQISTFSVPKIHFKLLLKIITFFSSIFEFFHRMYLFLIQFIFQKSFLWSKGKW